MTTPIQKLEHGPDASSSVGSLSLQIEDDNVSELTELTELSLSPPGEATAGRSSAQQRSRDGDVAGNRKKRGTGGNSSLVLG
jgi:hypothetical protein